MIKRKNIIIGGGFTGMLLASRLEDVTMISRDMGGLISTYQKGGFTFDDGGHVYSAKHDQLSKLMRQAGGVLHEERKAFYLPKKNLDQFVEYPVQANAKQINIDVCPDYNFTDYKNFYELSRFNFGQAFTEQFLEPFNHRVWSTPMSQMDVDWIDGRVQRVTEKNVNWGSNSSFWYAQGNDIIDVLQEKAGPQLEYIEGYVHHIDVEGKAVHYNKGHETHDIEYENLFVTTPYFLPFHRRNRILTIGIGLNKRLPLDFHWLYNNLSFRVHRTTLLSRYHPKNAPEGCDSLLMEIPYYPHGFEQSKAVRLQQWLEAQNPRTAGYQMICEAGLRDAVEMNDIEVLWTHNSPGYPVPTLGSRREVAVIKTLLMPKQIYLLGRFGNHLYANLEHLYSEVDSVLESTVDAENYVYSRHYYKR